MWCGVVWCGVVWCGVVWCIGGCPAVVITLTPPPPRMAKMLRRYKTTQWESLPSMGEHPPKFHMPIVIFLKCA